MTSWPLNPKPTTRGDLIEKEGSVPHGEVLRITRQFLGEKYSKQMVKEVITAYIKALRESLATTRKVLITDLGALQTTPGRQKPPGSKKYIWGLTPRFQLSQTGSIKLREAVARKNYIKNVDDPDKKVRVVPKKYESN